MPRYFANPLVREGCRTAKLHQGPSSAGGQDQHFQPRVDGGVVSALLGATGTRGWDPTACPQEVGAGQDLEDWGKENQRGVEAIHGGERGPRAGLSRSSV